MSALSISGLGLVGPAGNTPDELVSALSTPGGPVDVTGMYEAELPGALAYALPEFSTRAELGRKGTSFFDRRTALTVIACGRALADAGVAVSEEIRDRTGIVVGTTAGSVRSSVDYAVETFTQDPPHLVNPALFPTTVMNCAAGQSAIWYGLRGVNATLAGGRTAFLSVLRYCRTLLRCGRADTLIAAAIDEFTPHAAWLTQLSGADVAPGEGGAAFVVRGAAAARGDAEVLDVRLGFCPRDTDISTALGATIRGVLDRAGLAAGEITTVASGTDDDAFKATVAALDGRAPRRLRVDEVVGDCPTAVGAVELAALLSEHRADPARDGAVSLLVARTPEGAFGVAAVRAWSRS
ncbi:beta-ketoacyl synthase N-terminal-like domain-containing protein [Actinokineospora enzanensis]|uniref:beta-ketoacyl synthase N-terminal-like domain-containing protein n=1 Tax=Actinokineospora enzanensis TaxID=155975 RepID=UPI00037A9C89|nr:beta-ketoacyl synthase N-terminal-like domain-containing protein [Actinokineospora enzanensis]